MKKEKIPKEIIKEIDINSEEEKPIRVFEVSPRIEPHQIKLPIPRELIRELELETKWKNKKKIKLVYDNETNELRFKI